MSFPVRIRPRAVADLEQMYDYLAQRNVRAADRFADAVASDLNKLADMPGMGTRCRVRNASLKNLRSWPVTGFRKYLVFYLRAADGIEVVRVFHGARDVDRLLRRE